MTSVADPTLYWAVLARVRGEVLAAEAESPGLHLGVIGIPVRFVQREAETWLYDVIGVAHEAVEGPEAAHHVPALLKHALTGLVFSHAELWDPAGEARPCSFAFAHTVRDVGFGVVGESEVTLWVDGERVEPQWVVVRDEVGREARAWSIGSDHSVQVRITWSGPGEEVGGADAEVEAVWSAAPPAAETGAPPDVETSEDAPDVAFPDEREDEIPESAADESLAGSEVEAGPEGVGEPQAAIDAAEVEPFSESAPVESRPRGSAIGRWWRRGLSWFGVGKSAGESATPVSPDAPAPTPESEPLEPALVIEGSGVPLEDRPATAPESSFEERLEPEAPISIERLPVDPPPVWRRIPDRVPPTPEPREVTARTVGWSDPPDPRAIDLPPASSRASGESEADGLVESDITTQPSVEPEATGTAEEGAVAGAFAIAEEHPAAAEESPVPLQEASAPVETASGPAETVSASVVRPVRRLILPQQRTWPTLQQMGRSGRPLWQRPWAWAAIVAVLFAGGWLLGAIQNNGERRDTAKPGGWGAMVRAIGLGGPTFQLEVTSHPPGAWIAVDGKAASARTPAEIDLRPGEHRVTLSFADLGGASYTVRGLKGERVPLEATLWGALEIFSPDEVGVFSVTVDGEPRGVAPLRVDSLSPGVHELRFSGPGTPAWGQTVDLHVGETCEVLARAMASPASGVLLVQGRMTDEQGSQPLKGAQVWIDGELRGVTPLTLDLARGPHSVRVAHKGEEAPIQVIDLPGGNQRFAVFEFGLENDSPRLLIDLPPRVPRDRPVTISATLQGAGSPEAREMWLHAQMPGGPWRRYPMTLLKGASGMIGTTVFPTVIFDAQGRARYYVSAQYGQGEESFSEIRSALLDKPATR